MSGLPHPGWPEVRFGAADAGAASTGSTWAAAFGSGRNKTTVRAAPRVTSSRAISRVNQVFEIGSSHSAMENAGCADQLVGDGTQAGRRRSRTTRLGRQSRDFPRPTAKARPAAAPTDPQIRPCIPRDSNRS